jgi:hypothetical protein
MYGVCRRDGKIIVLEVYCRRISCRKARTIRSIKTMALRTSPTNDLEALNESLRVEGLATPGWMEVEYELRHTSSCLRAIVPNAVDSRYGRLPHSG